MVHFKVRFNASQLKINSFGAALNHELAQTTFLSSLIKGCLLPCISMDFPEKLNPLRYACPDPSPDSSISRSEPKFGNSKTLIKSSSSWQQSSIRSRHFLSSKPESFDPLLQTLTLLIGILHLLYLFLSNPIERERERERESSFRFDFCVVFVRILAETRTEL